MTQYASNTTVSAEKSRGEIERILGRYGADEFAYASSRTQAMIAFAANGRRVRFLLPLPDPSAAEFSRTPTGRTRADTARNEAYEQAVRQRWRALALMVKAKLEAVESGIVTFEQEFLPHILVPGSNETVYEQVAPRIEQAYLEGHSRPLLSIGA